MSITAEMMINVFDCENVLNQLSNETSAINLDGVGMGNGRIASNFGRNPTFENSVWNAPNDIALNRNQLKRHVHMINERLVGFDSIFINMKVGSINAHTGSCDVVSCVSVQVNPVWFDLLITATKMDATFFVLIDERVALTENQLIDLEICGWWFVLISFYWHKYLIGSFRRIC